MRVSTHVLWRVNNEYRRRLSQAETLLNLLEQLLITQRGGQEHTLAALAYAREQLEALVEEHRQWRYRYYYESVDSKRMVQDDRAVNQAMSRFSRMRASHERSLQDLHALLFELPRPDPLLTRVPHGDLWTMTQYAVADLVMFDDFLNELSQNVV